MIYNKVDNIVRYAACGSTLDDLLLDVFINNIWSLN